MRRTWLFSATAAVIVAAGAALTVALVHHSTPERPRRLAGPVDASGCPLTHPGFGSRVVVPAPAQGVDAKARLVPNTTPTAVLLCMYTGKPPDYPKLGPVKSVGPPSHLVGHRALAGLDTVRAALTWQPKITNGAVTCAVVMGAHANDYLVRATYPTGSLWVHIASDGCGGATNGAFASLADLHTDAASAYAQGRWPSGGQVGIGPCAGNPGRLGTDSVMVPATPTRVDVCTFGRTSRGMPSTTNIAELVRALNALPTSPQSGLGSCRSRAVMAPTYRLEFIYGEGPPLYVDVNEHCTPGVTNRVLAAADSRTVVPIIEALLRAG